MKNPGNLLLAVCSRRNLSRAVVAVAALCVAILLGLAWYAVPTPEDYLYAVARKDLGTWVNLRVIYLNWSGRYAATLLSDFSPFSVCSNEYASYPWFALGTVALWAVTCVAGLKLIAGRLLNWRGAVVLGALYVVVCLSLFENLLGIFYWWYAVTAYLLPTLLGIWLLGLTRIEKPWAVVGALLLAAFVPAGNEVLGIMIVMILGYMAFVSRRRSLWVVAAVAAAALVVMVLAPGNFVRQKYEGIDHSVLLLLKQLGVTVLGTLLMQWRTLPTLLLATPVYLLLGGLKLAKAPVFGRISGKVFAVWSVLLFVAAQVPCAFAMLTFMDGRIAVPFYMLFALVWFVGVNIAVNRHAAVVEAFAGSLAGRITGVVSFAVLVTMQLFSVNSTMTTAAVDLASGSARRYHAMANLRMEACSKAEAQGRDMETTVVFEPLGQVPKSTYHVEFVVDSLDTVEGNSSVQLLRYYHSYPFMIKAAELGSAYVVNNIAALLSLKKGIQPLPTAAEATHLEATPPDVIEYEVDSRGYTPFQPFAE